jgi:hypothetical protein
MAFAELKLGQEPVPRRTLPLFVFDMGRADLRAAMQSALTKRAMRTKEFIYPTSVRSTKMRIPCSTGLGLETPLQQSLWTKLNLSPKSSNAVLMIPWNYGSYRLGSDATSHLKIAIFGKACATYSQISGGLDCGLFRKVCRSSRKAFDAINTSLNPLLPVSALLPHHLLTLPASGCYQGGTEKRKKGQSHSSLSLW